MPPFVEARRITKLFGGVAALNEASVSFSLGEVHCLAGENGCGKSTLMKVLSGAHAPTSGEIIVDDQTYGALTPRQAHTLGIELIYQDFSLLPNLNAAENIALPTLIGQHRRLVDRRRTAAIAERAIERLGASIDLKAPVGEFSVADRQLTAIARALAHDARLIAMDEPTTALTWREIDSLFETVDRLRASGTGIVFISHKMQEVFTIADRVSVMRNGEVIETALPSDLTPASLAEKMTGRAPQDTSQLRIREHADTVALEVRGLAKKDTFENISFTINSGEIVGLSGLLGSGRTEIANALAGVDIADEGRVLVDGVPVDIRNVADAMRHGIGYVPEDRLSQGLFLDQPIGDNLVVTVLDDHSRRGLLDLKRLRSVADDAITDLRIKAASPLDPVSTLSGGNAQRVLLGKWLERDPRILILNGPTVGVDVGSKFDILSILRMHSIKGLAVLIISDDIPELVSMCHRVLIVRGGRLVDSLAGAELTEQAVLTAVTA